MKKAILLCDVPEFRHDNEVHKIPLGAVVKVKNDDGFIDCLSRDAELTLTVLGHARDCDGTPLYTLGNGQILSSGTPDWEFAHNSSVRIEGLPEGCLTLTGENKPVFRSYKEMFYS